MNSESNVLTVCEHACEKLESLDRQSYLDCIVELYATYSHFKWHDVALPYELYDRVDCCICKCLSIGSSLKTKMGQYLFDLLNRVLFDIGSSLTVA